MGGIGKTTLATALYDRISHQFDACCFIDDISKVYRNEGRLVLKSKHYIKLLANSTFRYAIFTTKTNLIRLKLGHIRALLVLDNVDQVEQQEKLAVSSECLGAGSRIVITSRDVHILKEYEVDEIVN
ncbi:putative P-loop containing nucleoside triphosphate hydrolase [Medicago truncatula]|uniref:NBS-LRR type disease resistance protein n=1 Tax=Medicago truncatula TaxID=3880 RepID=A0A072UMX3_MEDTR|nr:disease resistance protein RRS1B [Medicago truncatula]KEH30731.1 NBS-LRR type disease resistance protein [Medicago truncatula]RHN61866.1 putative P-loop containing nucleoside triphosphate hydrolase [Medicago truncatula]